ncbi:hypothetical protein N9E09_01035 [bacterium]|jgi:hypothetical protein|nr:hypothetical protein [bacterium]
MANIKEEILIIRVSQLSKSGEDKANLINDEVSQTIEQVVAELIGSAAIVEVDTAEE